MAHTTISGGTFGFVFPTGFGTTFTMAVFCDTDFDDEDGVRFLASAGNGLTSEFVAKVAGTVSSGVGTYVPYSLPKTDLATPANARYYARIFDSRGNATDYFPFSSRHLRSSLGASTSELLWAIDNQQRQYIQADTKPSTADMNAAIAAAISNAALNQDYVIGDYASFAAAITALTSGGGTLVINEATTCTTNTTVPANITLRFTRKGSLTISNSVTCTIAGPIEAGPVKIFYNALSGQGTVSFSGNLAVRDFYPEWWGAVSGGTDQGSKLVAVIAAIDTAGAGNLMWGANNFGSSIALVVGAAATQHKINIVGVNNVVSVLTWLGSTAAVALTLNVEKYCTVSNLRILNGVAKGTTEGIRLTGNAGTGTQTSGGTLNLVVVDGFHYGLRTSNGAAATSSEISYFNFTAQNCDTGIITDDANAISHNFYNLLLGANTVGMNAATSYIHIWGGSASNNTADFVFSNDGASSIIGFYSEMVTNLSIDFTTAAGANKLSLINYTINGVSTPNAHTVIRQQGGKLSIQDSNIGGQIVFVQGSSNSSISLKNCSIIDPNNTFTATASPDLMGPGFRLLTASGGGGSTFESFGNTQCTGDFNTIAAVWPSGFGFVPIGVSGQGICFMRDHQGSDVVSTAAIYPTGGIFHVTGTNTITSMNATDFPDGTVSTLLFDSTAAVTDGSNLKLAGSLSASADDTLTLRKSGSNWYEMGRSVN